MIRRKTLFVLITMSVTILLSSCSAESTAVQVSPTSLPSMAASTATPEPPTEIPPTTTLSPTPEVIELNPSPRGYVNMAYDSESGQIILFGGQTGSIGKNSDETWAYDVTTNEWINMHPSESPHPGSAGSLVYDVESDRVILFGNVSGNSFRPSRDTWAYDFNTNTWTKLSAEGPANHLGSQMAYDTESDRVILFGGYQVSRNELYDDTRVYDLNADTWMNMKPEQFPPARNYECMTYDSIADRVILWGGDMSIRPKDTSLWAYDFNTNTWEVHPVNNGPDLRAYCGMVYSAKADKVFIYGGHSEGSSEMWAYDYNTDSWSEITPDVNPGELSRFAIAYVPDLDEIVLFGGQLGDQQFVYTQATWVYDVSSNTWTETTRYEND